MRKVKGVEVRRVWRSEKSEEKSGEVRRSQEK